MYIKQKTKHDCLYNVNTFLQNYNNCLQYTDKKYEHSLSLHEIFWDNINMVNIS